MGKSIVSGFDSQHPHNTSRKSKNFFIVNYVYGLSRRGLVKA